jgi:hypothetical protein
MTVAAVLAPSIAAIMASAVLAQTNGATVAPMPSSQPGASAAVASAHPREDLAGTWKYNDDLSVNAATGRPETARAANERRGVGAGSGGVRRPGVGSGGSGAGGPGASSFGGGPGGGGPDRGLPPGAAASLYAAQRDTQRDLLEIAPELRITITPRDVTVLDDLNRSLTFPTDARKQKYQLGAATFEARSYWDGSQLKKDIEGPDGLKMNETFFLSEGGDRLFLIIRVGERARAKELTPVGVNRVYDRAK